jgi:prepilin-type N-terminal cleavage/methylation domain-containing protein
MKLFNEKYQYKAFTLAEVLITLLIIGVIASLVVPNLINDSQNEEFYTLLKKDYSALSDASKRMLMDAGGNFSGYLTSSSVMREKFSEYMVFTKECTYNEHGCFHAGTNTWKTLHGDDGWLDNTIDVTVILNNGGLLRFGSDSSTCSVNYGTGTPAQYSCGWMHLDVNGFKGPNVLGRDIYALWITRTGIYPFGMYKDIVSDLNVFCNKNSTDPWSGRGCAAKVLKGDKVD